MNKAKPLLKWAGGKRAIAELLQSHFPSDWQSGKYFEPFIGGGAMLFSLEPKESVISDLNAKLINFYQSLVSDEEEVFRGITALAEEFNSKPFEEKKDFYLEIRRKYNAGESKGIQSAINLYALNKLCFNGLYRENAGGGFNVPFGQKNKFPPVLREDFAAATKVLARAQILNLDFEKTLEQAQAGDFVYLDPPYIPLNESASFTSYQAGGFNLEQQESLASWMDKLKSIGVNALCSNSDTPLTRKVFSNFKIKTIQAPRMVSASANGRGSIQELIITNFDE